MKKMPPEKIIAEWLWNDGDAIDYEDMGLEAGKQLVEELDKAGLVIVQKHVISIYVLLINFLGWGMMIFIALYFSGK